MPQSEDCDSDLARQNQLVAQAMYRRTQESGLSKRRRFGIGFLFLFMLLVVSDGFAESETILVWQDNATILGQRRLSNLFFFNRRPSDPIHVRTWLRGFGNWTTQSGNSANGAVEAKAYGVSLGIDRQLGRNVLVGASLGGSWCSAEEKQWNETTDVSAFHGTLYTRIQLQRLYFDAEGGLGSVDKRSEKNVTAFQSNLSGEVGTWWEAGLARVEPYLGVRQVWYDDHSPRYGEKTTSVLGLRYSWKTATRLAVTTPRIYGGWFHEWSARDLVNAATFTDSPIVYRLNGTTLNADRLFVGGGFTTAMGSSLDVYLRYTAEMASNFSAHTLLLGMNWNY